MEDLDIYSLCPRHVVQFDPSAYLLVTIACRDLVGLRHTLETVTARIPFPLCPALEEADDQLFMFPVSGLGVASSS
ncbi:hypothetical protein RRG08_049269 [Elysia crispata]|uniref:Uncharacterized protein n=1 Tax=Elysia crispata TaxID=231223 RepID=A0AAE0ZNN2_9GAST|nr:hypothetical protein RRG08_049269 [Elysia crispata]